MLPLHPHNQKTFGRLCRLFEDHDRAAVVQPTGTGKSFVILRLIEDNADKRFVVCSPSAYIFSQIKAHAKKYGICLENCEFVTYTKLSQTDAGELKDKDFNFVVLDEFHRCGAAEWSKGVQNLLDSFPNAKVLGTSATPIRYLDSCRDMAQELFDGIYASNMSLAEAIRLGILPLPIYVTSFYSFRGETERLEERANRTGNPRLKRVLLGKLQEAKRLITQNDCGLESIFKRHIPDPNGKYIVFCPGVEKLIASMKECGDWFGSVNRNLHKYAVYSSDNSSEKQFADSKNDPQAAELYIWINSQQKKLASGKMSDEQKRSLDEMNFPWTRNTDSWIRQFELLKEFVAENGLLPKRDDLYKGAKLGVWYASQLNALKSGKLSGDKKTSH